MAKAAFSAERHEAIEELNPHLWRVEAPLPGTALRRVMAVAKRSDGDLVVHSGICLDEPSMARLEAWGRIRYVVVPNGFHRMGGPRYKSRYPDALVVCPAGARARVEKTVGVDLTYDEYPQDEWVRLEYLDGVGEREGVMIVRADDGVTLVMNDALFNAPHGTGLFGFVFRHVTASTGGPRVSRLFKLAAIRDKRAFRAGLERLAEIPELCRVVVSHHRVIDDDPSGALRAAAAGV